MSLKIKPILTYTGSIIRLEPSKIEIRAIGLPKLSHLVQQEFYRALRTLRTHELQDSNMKAAIEFARDLLCIDEIDFDDI